MVSLVPNMMSLPVSVSDPQPSQDPQRQRPCNYHGGHAEHRNSETKSGKTDSHLSPVGQESNERAYHIVCNTVLHIYIYVRVHVYMCMCVRMVGKGIYHNIS